MLKYLAALAIAGSMVLPAVAAEVYAIAVCHIFSDPVWEKANDCQLYRPEYFMFSSSEACKKSLDDQTGMRNSSSGNMTTTFSCVSIGNNVLIYGRSR